MQIPPDAFLFQLDAPQDLAFQPLPFGENLAFKPFLFGDVVEDNGELSLPGREYTDIEPTLEGFVESF